MITIEMTLDEAVLAAIATRWFAVDTQNADVERLSRRFGREARIAEMPVSWARRARRIKNRSRR